MCSRGLVERLGGHVEPIIGPHDGAVRHGNARESVRVAQWFEHAAPLMLGERHIADGAILKEQPESVLADHGDTGYVYEWQGVGHDEPRC